jgi:hypothetical protein
VLNLAVDFRSRSERFAGVAGSGLIESKSPGKLNITKKKTVPGTIFSLFDFAEECKENYPKSFVNNRKD